MRRIAVINQKGGVGKTTTSANLGAALAQQGRRVVLIDMDAQANLSISLGVELESNSPSTYTVLLGESTIAEALRPTTIENLSIVASNIDLSGAELELAGAIGREHLMRDALSSWEVEHRKAHGRPPADYVIFDCPPSLGLLSVNALAAAGEVLITLQTEFLALQGMTKLVDVVQLLRRRVNPELVITGILPCLYDSRLKLAREVLGEIRNYFGAQVFPHPVRTNVKLAEAPSFGKTIFEYAPESNGAQDYRLVAREVMLREARDPDLAGLPPYRESRDSIGTTAAPEAASANGASLAGVTSKAGARPKVRVTETTEGATEPIRDSTIARGAAPRSAVKDHRAEESLVHGMEKTGQTAPTANETRTPSRGRKKRQADAPSSDTLVTPATVPQAAPPPVVKARGSSAPIRKTPALQDEETLAPHTGTTDPQVVLAPQRKPSAAARKARRSQPAATEHVETPTVTGQSAEGPKVVTNSPATAPLREAREARDASRRIVRAEDLPPLPPDAFEILTNYVRDA